MRPVQVMAYVKVGDGGWVRSTSAADPCNNPGEHPSLFLSPLPYGPSKLLNTNITPPLHLDFEVPSRRPPTLCDSFVMCVRWGPRLRGSTVPTLARLFDDKAKPHHTTVLLARHLRRPTYEGAGPRVSHPTSKTKSRESHMLC